MHRRWIPVSVNARCGRQGSLEEEILQTDVTVRARSLQVLSMTFGVLTDQLHCLS